MKSTVEVKKAKDLPFPKLMKSTRSDKVVLFEKYRCGTVVSDHKDMGMYSEIWLMQNFRDFDGSVTLEN